MSNIKIKFYLTVFFVAIFLAGISFFVTWRLYQNVAELSGRFVLETENLASVEIKKKFLKTLEYNLKNLEKDIAEAEAVILPKSELISAIKFLEKTASDSGANVEIKSVEASETDSAVFRISLSGSFAGVSRFLKILENGPYLVSFGDFSVNRLSGFVPAVKKTAFPLSDGDVSADFEIVFFAK